MKLEGIEIPAEPPAGLPKHEDLACFSMPAISELRGDTRYKLQISY
jgi:hypothetical protein